jgi:dihydroceramidase
MPQNLDEDTRTMIFTVSIVYFIPLSGFNLYMQHVLLPRMRANLKSKSRLSSDNSSSLFLIKGCFASLAIMIVLSFLSTSAIIAMDKNSSDNEALRDKDVLSSSINFCEADFTDSKYMAEPANAMSSLVTFCPLALLGLFGPTANQWSVMKNKSNRRFLLAYISLFLIGAGSFWLHAVLTAEAQAGDELPMLWYVAIMGFIAMDSILDRQIDAEVQNNHDSKRGWLAFSCAVSAMFATGTYVSNREDFAIFYIMFSTYSVMILAGIITLSFSSIKQYSAGDEESFRGNVLLPLLNSSLWWYILASATWVFEMLYCDVATKDRRWGEIAHWLWNRGVHPLWHCSIALVAFLLVQILYAVRGFQHGLGEAHLKWYGAPYVSFHKVAE